MATNSKSCGVKCIQMIFSFSIKHLGLMSDFIVPVLVLIGYFKKIILANLRVL